MKTFTQTNNRSMNRIDYIDMSKGIGMLAIIWGHIMLTGWSNALVYSFHIPLFFFLSGMMFDRKKYPTFGLFIKRRTKSLLIPYVMFSFVTWVLWASLNILQHNKVNFFRPLLQTVLAQGSGGFLVHNVPLWFVTCLFVVEALYYLISGLPKWVNIGICIFMAFIGNYMIRGGHLSFYRLLPWNIEGAMSAILFYAAGNLLMSALTHDQIQGLAKKNLALTLFSIVVLTMVLSISSCWNGHVTIGSNSLGKNTLLFYCNGFIGTVSTILFSIFLVFINVKRIVFKRVLEFFKWIGQNSYYVMASHVPVKGLFVLLFAKVAGMSQTDYCSNMGNSLLVFVASLLADSIIVWFMIKLRKHDESMMQKNHS